MSVWRWAEIVEASRLCGQMLGESVFTQDACDCVSVGNCVCRGRAAGEIQA